MRLIIQIQDKERKENLLRVTVERWGLEKRVRLDLYLEIS